MSNVVYQSIQSASDDFIYSMHCIADSLYKTLPHSFSEADLNEAWDMLNLVHYDRVSEMINDCDNNTLLSLFNCRSKEKIVLGPCPDYVVSIIPRFAQEFQEIILIDNGKAGTTLAGYKVISSDEFVKDNSACYFIPTITKKILDIYCELFKDSNVTTIPLLSNRYSKTDNSISVVEAAVTSINNNPEAIVLISQYFSTTLIPTFKALQESGKKIIWLGGILQNLGYSIVDDRHIPFEDIHLLNFEQLLSVLYLSELNGRKLLFNVESYIHPLWDMRRTAQCYLIGATLSRCLKTWEKGVGLTQMLYDPIKGGLDNKEYDHCVAEIYKEMMQSADSIIYSSSVHEMGGFIENALIPET